MKSISKKLYIPSEPKIPSELKKNAYGSKNASMETKGKFPYFICINNTPVKAVFSDDSSSPTIETLLVKIANSK